MLPKQAVLAEPDKGQVLMKKGCPQPLPGPWAPCVAASDRPMHRDFRKANATGPGNLRRSAYQVAIKCGSGSRRRCRTTLSRKSWPRKPSTPTADQVSRTQGRDRSQPGLQAQVHRFLEGRGPKARPIRRQTPPLSTRCHRSGRQPSKESGAPDPNRELARKDAKSEGKDEGRFFMKRTGISMASPLQRLIGRHPPRTSCLSGLPPAES